MSSSSIRGISSVAPAPANLFITICLCFFFTISSRKVCWYGNIENSLPSFCGRPSHSLNLSKSSFGIVFLYSCQSMPGPPSLPSTVSAFWFCFSTLPDAKTFLHLGDKFFLPCQCRPLGYHPVVFYPGFYYVDCGFFLQLGVFYSRAN